MSQTNEPEGRSWAPEATEDLDRAAENVLEGWPSPEPDEEPDEIRPEQSEDDEAGFPSHDEPWRDGAPDAAQAAVEAPDAESLPEGHDEELETSSEHAPGELAIPPGYSVLEGEPRGGRRAVGIVVSRFNGEVTGKLLTSALDELTAYGVGADSITVMPVPGAFELPIAAMALAKTRRFACVVALGCVIRGDTPHFDYVASEAASGLQLAAIETGVPVAFGVLTLDRQDQAAPRFAKGAEAVRTALEMADLFANLRAAAAAR